MRMGREDKVFIYDGEDNVILRLVERNFLKMLFEGGWSLIPKMGHKDSPAPTVNFILRLE